ncbi:MAG: hypothetical protein J6T42_05005, partial [Clostridia bacterium]|nr:hypothetical protein [Clostridia bacterium]
MIKAITDFFTQHGYVAEVFLSCLIFTIRLPRRKLFVGRVVLCVACFFGISFLFNYLESLFPAGDVPNYLPMIRYSLCYVIVVLSIWFDFDVKYLIALFLGISSVAAQHFSYKTGELVSRLLSPYLTDGWTIAIYVAVLLSAYTAIFFLFAGKMKNLESEYLELKQTIYIAIALVLYTTMFQYSTSMQMNYYVIYALYDMLCCAFTLTMQVNSLNAGKYMHEYKVGEYINYQSTEQYDLAKKNIELLNIKFHDLKKMISNMGADISLDEKYELERAISIYDTTIQTGNEVLDVILTEKSMFCDQVGIRFERIADGSLLA